MNHSLTSDDVSRVYNSEESVRQESESGELNDRLSELPDSLIHTILSFLPMRDVVRTTLLSKRWEDLWTTVPCLDFSLDINSGGSYDHLNGPYTFSDFVNKALLLWKGTKILKFNVAFDFDRSRARINDLDTWLRVAMEKGVEELCINLTGRHDVWRFISREYFPPHRLYSCSSIRKLSLVSCNLTINKNVQWDQLKCLRIDGVCHTEHVINQVLSGTPQLEVLFLRIIESFENLNIQSSSLKKLMVEKYREFGRNVAMDTSLRIWAPNVETLGISGFPYSKCVLMNASSLTNVTLDFRVSDHVEQGIFFGRQLLEDILGQVSESTRYVEKVTLSDWSSKMLGERKKDMLAPLSNAKFLKLYTCTFDGIMGIFEIFPKLMVLVLESNPWSDRHFFEIICHNTEPFVPKFDAENSSESETNVPDSYPLHLRTVEITCTVDDESIFQFVEILLENARKLEKVMFQCIGLESHGPLSLCWLAAAQKLLRMSRSSPSAEVIFPECCLERLSKLWISNGRFLGKYKTLAERQTLYPENMID